MFGCRHYVLVEYGGAEVVPGFADGQKGKNKKGRRGKYGVIKSNKKDRILYILYNYPTLHLIYYESSPGLPRDNGFELLLILCLDDIQVAQFPKSDASHSNASLRNSQSVR